MQRTRLIAICLALLALALMATASSAQGLPPGVPGDQEMQGLVISGVSQEHLNT